MPRTVRLLLIGLLLGLATAVYHTTAYAHAVPVSSSPAPNEILPEPPAQLLMTFNEPVVPQFSRFTLLTSSGEEVDIGPIQPTTADNLALTTTLPPLEDGAYLVSWQVLSGVDGHTTSGTFSFGVGGDTTLTAVSNQSTLIAQFSLLSSAARWLTILGVTLILGLFTFRLFIWNPIWKTTDPDTTELAIVDHRLATWGVRAALIGVGLIALALILIFVYQNQTYDLISGNTLQTWLTTRFGSVWLLRFFLVAMLLFLLTTFIQPDTPNGRRGAIWWVGLLLSVALAATIPLVSHAAALAEDSTTTILVDFVHTLAATFWIGGLAHLALALWLARPLPAEERSWLHLNLVLYFSGLAALAVGLLTASGLFLARTHVGSWINLVGTAYGLTLLAKLGVALLTFLTAGFNLLYIKPRLNTAYEHPEAPESETAVTRFRYLVWAELLLAVIILLLTGLLTDMQRGADAPLLADAPGKTIIVQHVEDLTIATTITPALVGQNSFAIAVTDANGRPATNIEELSARFTFLGQSLGATEATAEAVGPGLYQLDGSYISLIGPWQMEIAVQRTDQFDTFVAYRLDAGVGGNIRAQDSGERPLEEAAQFLTLTSGGGTGLLLILLAIFGLVVALKAARNEWQLIPLLALSLLAFWMGANQMIVFFTEEYTPAKFATNPILPDAESIAIAQPIFQQNCAACHGETGRGDGPTGLTLTPPPADFAAGHTNTHSDGDLYYWILQGIPDRPMPAFETVVTKEEAWHLVNYVRRLSTQSR
jgi:copper transport protein